MKKGAFFINTSRGEMVDEASLLIALKTGHLSGAGIDVLEGDSSWGTATPENQNLIEFSRSSPEKIIITSHTGGFAKESILKTRNFITEKFLNISSI
jgi:D-3-phosphoglycerate dehydrogenase